MMRWSAGRELRLALAAALALAGISACGLLQSNGPLQNVTAGGQPNFSVASIYNSPGQTADFTAYLVNSSHEPVTLISAALIPIKGHPLGRLKIVAVQTGLGGIGTERGWPVPGISFRSFSGARLPRGQSNIIFGFEGNRVGEIYMTSGLKITYRYRGRLYTMQAWSAAVDCVVANSRSNPLHAEAARCNEAFLVAKKATETQAGV